MTFTVIVITLLPLAAGALADDASANPASNDSASKDSVSEVWAKDGWPLLKEFCIDCHNADLAEAELDLSGFEHFGAMSDGGGNSMNRVLEMVRFGAMPPEDANVPSDQQRKQLVSAIDRALFAASCDLRPRPGKVTARRLNRSEYNHSIRDLFGLDLHPADAFPSDEVGGGFDNNGDVLSLSPMLVEKYLAAAESVSQQVLLDPNSFPRIDEDRSGDRLVVVGDSKVGSFFGRFLAPASFAWAEFELPSDGEYEIEVRAGATLEPRKKDDDRERDQDKQQDKNDSDKDRGSDDKLAAGVFDDSGRLLGICHFGYFGGGGSSERDELKVSLQGGKQRLIVLPLLKNESLSIGDVNFPDMDQLDARRVAVQRKQLGKGLKPDGKFDEEAFPFMVNRISVEGPSQAPADWLPPKQKELVKRTPKRKGSKYVDIDEAATACLQPLMRRAFRGPVATEEVVPYAKLVSEAMKRDESYYRGLQIAISAVLVSPRFLFRIETPGMAEEATDADQDVALTQHQLATRLSYFLWSSTPDDALLDLADKGQLRDQTLANQVERMLADSKSESLATEFASQWFGLRNLDGFEPDADKFEGVDAALLELMKQETQRLFMEIVRKNRPVDELISADYTFVNERLAKHYELADVRGDEFRRVSLADVPRRGVLSHSSVLTLTSNPTRTSPVKRGKWILENILGTPPPEPPPGVPELEATATASANATLREQMELHRENASCASCHRVMDDLGFGLEEFDAVGRYRRTDGDQPIDASGELPGGRNFNGAAELCRVLASSERESFVRTATARLMTFALGRELSPTDRCTVDEITERASASGGRFRDVVLEIVGSRQFQFYQWNGNDS